MSGLRLIFMGTPDFSVPALAALIDAGHDVVCVYSQPPRPAGRGQKERPSAVQAFAASKGIEVRTPVSLKAEDAQAAFAALEADIAVVVAYGLILPKAILAAPRLGCLNIHASLLPRWRGAAPIQRALLAGDTETGVTIMQMDEGLDTGDMLSVQTLPITSVTTASDLHDGLAAMGGAMIVAAVAGLEAGTVTAIPQPDEGVTYASKLDKAEGRIDWARPAAELDCQIRGLTPWPGVWCDWDGKRLKVLAAAVVDGAGAPGTVVDDALGVACGEGALRLTRVQLQGKAAMDADAFLNGYPMKKGARLT